MSSQTSRLWNIRDPGGVTGYKLSRWALSQMSYDDIDHHLHSADPGTWTHSDVINRTPDVGRVQPASGRIA